MTAGAGAMSLATTARWALREAKGGLRHFRIFIVCLAIGVGVIAAVLTLNHSLTRSLEEEGQVILGGDIAVEMRHVALGPSDVSALEGVGQVSAIVQMRAMARVPDKEPALAEVKAVDDAYPLYGRLAITPDQPLEDALAAQGDAWGGLADPTLLARLGIGVGDRLTLGSIQVLITGTIETEPDLASDGFLLGPRLLISRAALTASGLAIPGSLMENQYRIKLPPGADLVSAVDKVSAVFGDKGVEISDRRQGAPGIERFLDRTTFFLTLGGLISLIVGGVGIATATYFYLESRTETIATLKSLGARQGDIARLYLLVLLVMGTLGILVGLAVGLAGAYAGFSMLGGELPFRARFLLGWTPLLYAVLVGYLVVLGLGILPVGRAARISPAALFRQVGLSARGRVQSGIGVVAGLSGLALLCLVMLIAPRPVFALYFLAGTAAVGALLWGIGTLMAGTFRRLPRPHAPRLALALGNLARPGHTIQIIMVSLGLGMSLLVAMAHLRASLGDELQGAVPENAPSFFLTDIRREDMPRLEALLDEAHVEDFNSMPMIRGRVTHLNGVEPEIDELDPDGRWIMRGDRGFTFAAEPPRDTHIVEGEWWPADYDGPPLVSIEAEAGYALGLKPGDKITINVLGRPIEVTVANFRKVDWSTMAINFALVFSPNTLAGAPYQYLATVRVPPAAEPALATKMGGAFPNITIIRVSAVLAEVSALLGKVMSVISAAAGVTILCGLLVVAGATAAGFRQRLKETAILRAIGATSRDIQWAFLAEFLALGAVVAVLALAAGTLGAWFIVTFWLEGTWSVGWHLAGWVLVGVIATAIAFAMVSYRHAMRQPVTAVLRIP